MPASPVSMIGIDVTSVGRIAALLQRQPRFATRVFTERERRRCGDKAERFASRFAAKEAVRKVFGSAGLSIPAYSAIEVVNRPGGAPTVAVAGEPTALQVSLTHDAGVAIAVVTGEPQSGVGMTETELQLPLRPNDAHKGKFGTVIVIGGSVGFSGAPILAAMGALRGGAGLARLLVPEDIYSAVASHCLEIMPSPLPAHDGGVAANAVSVVQQKHAKTANCWVIGPGLGTTDSTRDFVLALLPSLIAPAVVDADALNVAAAAKFSWRDCRAPIVLTPHPGEMSRLSGIAIGDIQSHRREVAQEFAQKHQVTVVLKGANTVVAAGDGRCWTSPDATVALATGGSGDVLAGLLGSMLAQGLDGFAAAVAAVSIHAHAGKTLQARMGRAGVIPSDILAELPAAQERIRRALERMQ